MRLGSSINGVAVTFKPAADADVTPDLVKFVSDIIRPDVASGRVLQSIHVSSTSEPCEAHKPGDPHRLGRAIDISGINGRLIIASYGKEPEVTEIVDAIQLAAIPNIRTCENFGPRLYQKEGHFIVRSDHKDHIHLRVHNLREVLGEVKKLP